jgi:HKD family nuclease/diadenosine tetraphosphate (Ap4A) HIT family hydrolase
MPPVPAICPFCLPAAGQVAFAGPLTKAIWDAFPVTEGHLLLTPHRHVAIWSELHPSEQAALIGAIETAQTLLNERHAPDGFNVGFNQGVAAGQTIDHFHIHVIPRRAGDVADPRGGVRHVIPETGNYLAGAEEGEGGGLAGQLGSPSSSHAFGAGPSFSQWEKGSAPHARALIAGGEDALIRHLTPHIDEADRVDIAVSFVMESGVRLLRPHLQDLLDRGGGLRLITGDYLDVTDPAALRRLMDLEGRAELKVFEAGMIGFHPKSWIFHFVDGSGVALVGSSNLSEAALKTGVEWNYRTFTPDQQGGWRDVLEGFDALIARDEIKPLTHDWIDAYEARRVRSDLPRGQAIGIAPETPPPAPEPHAIQRQALAALDQTRADGFTAGMVVLATGLGKTWLSAFDSRPFARVLFVAHREEILTQALETFRACRPGARLGRYAGAENDLEADVLFASVQTLGRVRHLRQFAPDTFDYIVVDEFHHAAARTYRALIDYFTPKFLLGLTATPDRMDGGDLLGLCQENLVFRCDAFEGIEAGLLSPFHYFGVPDEVDYANIPWRGRQFDEQALTAPAWPRRRGRATPSNSTSGWPAMPGRAPSPSAYRSAMPTS